MTEDKKDPQEEARLRDAKHRLETLKTGFPKASSLPRPQVLLTPCCEKNMVQK